MIQLRRLIKPLGVALTHRPRLIRCEICQGPRIQVRTDRSPRIGSRCLSCRGTAHHRAIFTVIRHLFGQGLEGLRGGSVYELSAHGALYHALQHRAKTAGYDFICSEFFDGVRRGELVGGVRCEDIEALTFSDAQFDLVTSTGLMEHVEHDEVGYREIARVLKPRGYYVFTVPYHEGSGTIVRARRRADDTIEHLHPPEYHSDPWHPDGVFTWRNYGPDITEAMAGAKLHSEVHYVAVSGLDHPMPVVVGRAT